jgi:hypothetical protein
VQIEPAPVPLLKVMIAKVGKERLIASMPPEEDLAERLRKYLELSGVKRA